MHRRYSVPAWLRVTLSLFIMVGLILSIAGLYVTFGVGLSYHGSKPGAAFIKNLLYLALPAVIAVAVVGGVQVWQAATKGLIALIGGWLALLAVFGTVGLGIWVFTKESEAIPRRVGDALYALPRGYAAGCGQMKGVCGVTCALDNGPIYGRSCRDAQNRDMRASIELGQGKITQLFSVYYHLHKENIRFEGDQVTVIPPEARITPYDADGMSGFTIKDGDFIFLLDADQRIIGHVNNQYGNSRVTLREPNGVLSFTTPNRRYTQPRDWHDRARFARGLIESWRCLDADCNRRFTKR